MKMAEKSLNAWVKNTVGKGKNAIFLHSVFKRLVPQTCKKHGLFGKGFTYKLN